MLISILSVYVTHWSQIWKRMKPREDQLNIAFQSKVRTNRKHDTRYTDMLMSLLWPWLWPHDLDIQTWPKDLKTFRHTNNELSMSSLLKVRALKTDTVDTQTKRCDCTLYHAAFAGSRPNQQLKANPERPTQLNSTGSWVELSWVVRVFRARDSTL